MRSALRYIWILLPFPFVLWGCAPVKKPLPALSETYAHNDKNPFGGYALFETLKAQFDQVRMVDAHALSLNTDVQIHSAGGRHSLYVIVANTFHPRGEDEAWMLHYVAQGNELFLSANEISPDFLVRLGVSTNGGTAYTNEHWGRMENTDVRIVFGKELPELSFRYFYFPFRHSFQKLDQQHTRILGSDSRGQPNFVVIFMGKGRLFLHLAPRSLGNYFLLTDKNLDYLHHILQYLHQQPVAVYWDNYYKRGNPDEPDDEEFSPLSVIMENPALKWAFFLAMTALLVFIFSNIKRRQRVIPRQDAPENATVDFVETISRLYFATNDNKNIAKKLITFFYNYIRNRYYLKPDATPGFAMRLAGKKGMPPERIEALLKRIRDAEAAVQLSNEELWSLNKELENFYNYK